jgi:hypothetical protein
MKEKCLEKLAFGKVQYYLESKSDLIIMNLVVKNEPNKRPYLLFHKFDMNS